MFVINELIKTELIYKDWLKSRYLNYMMITKIISGSEQEAMPASLLSENSMCA